MNEISILIGGKAGFGIETSGFLIASVLNRMGYYIYIYRDYPSIIRGGHTFTIIRASKEKIRAHQDKIDYLLALNQDTVIFHKERLKENSRLIFDSDAVKSEGIGIPVTTIVKEEKADELLRNSCLVGTLCKLLGVDWKIIEETYHAHSKDLELNLKITKRGYAAVNIENKIDQISSEKFPLLSGNEAISLGLVKGGLDTYVAYPMSPSSSVLHFLAKNVKNFNLKVIHPESEIGVILMALGFSYAGKKTAVGTSGGGFCLMNEGLSLSGMAEIPITLVVCQRPGPATGLPTYSGQSELLFVLNAGHGEFPRFVVAPGDVEEAYYWSCFALMISWKYQIPSIILSDKTLSEGTYSFNLKSIEEIKIGAELSWDKKEPYKRYKCTDNGVSPLAYVPEKDVTVKVNSYEHNESGITTENESVTKQMQEKRLQKIKYLSEELDGYKTVSVLNNSCSTALLCWGSNKGVVEEVAQKHNLKVIRPQILSPFPLKAIKEAMKGVKKIVSIENNATGQLDRVLSQYGISVHSKILKYDGRPFSVEELDEEVVKVIQ